MIDNGNDNGPAPEKPKRRPRYRGKNPRRFEELIAAILKDFGFDTELTPATRDGGRDIYAYVRNAVTSFLMFVECKRWASHRKVGIDVVQRVHGAAKAGGANKAMIVTSSFFTLPAQEERRRIEQECPTGTDRCNDEPGDCGADHPRRVA